MLVVSLLEQRDAIMDYLERSSKCAPSRTITPHDPIGVLCNFPETNSIKWARYGHDEFGPYVAVMFHGDVTNPRRFDPELFTLIRWLELIDIRFRLNKTNGLLYPCTAPGNVPLQRIVFDAAYRTVVLQLATHYDLRRCRLAGEKQWRFMDASGIPMRDAGSGRRTFLERCLIPTFATDRADVWLKVIDLTPDEFEDVVFRIFDLMDRRPALRKRTGTR